ncbi:MAG: hypothetical protein HKN95_12515, partial [Acidimicrobiia bacterium]|nr:hypothetical protein [Acidimicrobiia bacterium]
MNRSYLILALGLALIVAGCDSATEPATSPPTPTVTSLPPVTTTTATTTTTTTTTTLPPTYDLAVSVVDGDGGGVPDAVVVVGPEEAATDTAGAVAFISIEPAPIEVTRFGMLPASADWDGTEATVTVELEPQVIRAIRVSSYVAADRDMFETTLDLAANSTVNALVFDTKDESSYVLYESASEFAAEIGSINPMYDPAELIAEAKEAGLY